MRSLLFPPGGRLPAEDGEGPAVEFLDLLLEEAVAADASDVHLAPFQGGFRIQFRRDGLLADRPRSPATLPVYDMVLSRLKVVAGMQLAQRRLPQDGHFRKEIDGREVDFRASTLPTVSGESAVIRIFDRGRRAFALDELGLGAESLARIREAVNRPGGMILVAGPIGSGKTTTLYAMLHELATQGKKIITIEDPVEATIPSAVQVAVDERAGLTFAAGLRALVRHDPDILLIGEIRDAETARIAIQASVLGHLVLATIHAESAMLAVERLLHMDLDRYQLAVAFNLILSQRLVRRWAGHGPGGRTGIFELLLPGDDFKRRILTGDGILGARAEALWTDGLKKVAAGETTLEELGRVLPGKAPAAATAARATAGPDLAAPGTDPARLHPHGTTRTRLRWKERTVHS